MQQDKQTEKPKTDEDDDRITVNIPVKVHLPENTYTEEQERDICYYVANFSTKIPKVFKQLDWGVGAFVHSVIRNEDNVIVVAVCSLSEKLEYKDEYYTHAQFNAEFGKQDYTWPTTPESIIPEAPVLNMDRISTDLPTKKKASLEEVKECKCGDTCNCAPSGDKCCTGDMCSTD